MQTEEMYPVIAFERDHLRLHERPVFIQVTLILLVCCHLGVTSDFRMWTVEQLGRDN